jgi:hypothetical protein
MMIIKEITAKALPDFIRSEEYLNSKVIPISQHRAFSHASNPRVDADDVVLFLAYVEDEIAGYIGILGDQFFVNGQSEKIGWISCLWVDPSTKGKGIVKALLKQAFLRWNNKILITNFAPDVRGTYIRSELFAEPFKITGVRGYLRFNTHELLPAKRALFKQWHWVLRAGDLLLNTVNDIRLSFITLLNRPGKQMAFLSEIDAETNAFIQQHQQNNLPKRTVDELNWIMHYPWILAGEEKDKIQQRYYFSSVSKQFITLPIKIPDNNKLIKAFLYLTIRDKHLKVHYAFFAPGDIEQITAIIYQLALKYRCNMVTVFDPGLNDYIYQHQSPFLFKKRLEQEYFVSTAFDQEWFNSPQDAFQYGDGDGVFT